MFKSGASFLWPGSSVGLAVLGLIALLLIAGGVWLFVSSRQTAAQRERRRRLIVNRLGRMGDATVIDVRDDVLYYTYEVRGVAYNTSQDASDFHNMLPPDTSALIGPAGLKYSPGNPANSIIICEQWSGLRPQVQESHVKENTRS